MANIISSKKLHQYFQIKGQMMKQTKIKHWEHLLQSKKNVQPKNKDEETIYQIAEYLILNAVKKKAA